MPELLRYCLFAFVLAGLSGGAYAQQAYEKQVGVDGTIISVGSDTLANLMTFWSQEFKRLYPQVKFQIQASGSSTAPPALTEGTANIGPMSRELKFSETSAFVSRHGYQPTALIVGVDAIALFVDRRNPLPGLTLQQIDSIFSATRFCGAAQNITSWGQLGIDYLEPQRNIRLFGRNSVSGTYGLFKLIALCDGDFRATVNEQPGSASVVMSVASSTGALGYAAYGHKTAGVRALPIATVGKNYVPLTEQTVISGDYPLSRYLYLVINKPPGEALPTIVREFLHFVFSTEGQLLVQRDGYIGVPDSMIQRQLALIDNKE